MCASDEELLVDSCFGKGNGEAVGYRNVDEPVRLDAGDGCWGTMMAGRWKRY